MHSPRPNSVERAPLLWVVLPFASGIALADMGHVAGGVGVWAGVALIGLMIAWSPFRAFNRGGVMAIALVLVGAGGLHYSAVRNPLPGWENLPDREIEFTIKVERVFGALSPERGLSFLGSIKAANDPRNELSGQRVHVQLRATEDQQAIFARGATLHLVGRIGHLSGLPRDGFSQYLEDLGLNFRVRQARWQATVEAPSLYAAVRDEIKRQAATILEAGLAEHPALAGALRAMLLGERHELTDDAKALFVRSGTMHLFAISGLHIGVIATALYLLLRIGRLRPLAIFLIGAALLWFYVDLIGRPPSAVRAWLMITCYQAARVWRTPGNPLASIAASALLVLLLDPMQLFSAGFQMSYAVVFALLIHGLPLGEHWNSLIRPWRDIPNATLQTWQRVGQAMITRTLQAAALTWTASLIGLITSVAFFGWFTPLAFYANVLLVPLAGLVVAGGFTAIVVGLAGSMTLALVFNHAAALVLVAMQTVLEMGIGNTGSKLASFWLPAWGQTGMVAVLAAMVFAHERIDPTSRWHWWLPTGVSFLVLVIGLRFA